MKLVVGLGNPGPRYELTRHNIGFRVAERFALRSGIDISAERFSGLYGAGRLGDQSVAVLKPQAFMNRSGASVSAAVAELAIDAPERDLLLVYDEMDLPTGRLRLRHGGGPGGHNGIGDVILQLGTPNLPRLRFGVGRPPEGRDPIDWVLSDFEASEEQALVGVIDTASQALETFVTDGMDVAMNLFNLSPASEDETPEG